MSDAAPTSASHPADRTFYAFIALLSAGALGFLGWVLLVRRGAGGVGGLDLRFMPAVNASLNAVAASLLVAGWVAVRRGARRVHAFLMVGAFAASALFLVGYLAYHFVHGDTRYGGTGLARTFYLLVLASHVLLSLVVVPGALLAFYFAWRRSWARHRRVTRLLAPAWVYVSVTGVLIFFLLRGSLPPAP
jgi:putative membrane protein